MPAKKRGPKPKPPEEVRAESFRFLVTAEEKALIETAAERLGLARGASELIRDAALKRARQVLSKGKGKR